MYCATSFSALEENKKDKRRRLSTFAIEDIAFKVLPSIIFAGVDSVIIVSRIRAKSIIFALGNKFKFYGLKVFGYIRELLIHIMV